MNTLILKMPSIVTNWLTTNENAFLFLALFKKILYVVKIMKSIVPKIRQKHNCYRKNITSTGKA